MQHHWLRTQTRGVVHSIMSKRYIIANHASGDLHALRCSSRLRVLRRERFLLVQPVLPFACHYRQRELLCVAHAARSRGCLDRGGQLHSGRSSIFGLNGEEAIAPLPMSDKEVNGDALGSSQRHDEIAPSCGQQRLTWVCTSIGRNTFAATDEPQYVPMKSTDIRAYGSTVSMSHFFALIRLVSVLWSAVATRETRRMAKMACSDCAVITGAMNVLSYGIARRPSFDSFAI